MSFDIYIDRERQSEDLILPPPRKLEPPPLDFLGDGEGCLLLIGLLGTILFLVIHWK